MDNTIFSPSRAVNFMQRVAAMRKAQIDYYMNRNIRNLTIAKKLEKEVDNYIAAGMIYLDEHPQQLELWK